MTPPKEPQQGDIITRLVNAIEEDDLSEIRREVLRVMSDFELGDFERNSAVRAAVLNALERAAFDLGML